MYNTDSHNMLYERLYDAESYLKIIAQASTWFPVCAA